MLNCRISSPQLFNILARYTIFLNNMAPKRQAGQSILTGIMSSIIVFIQLNVAILNYQADYQRKRAALIRLLAMPVGRNAALKRVNKKRQAQRRRFWIRPGRTHA